MAALNFALSFLRIVKLSGWGFTKICRESLIFGLISSKINMLY
jgi:hypothetical protein